MKPTNTVQARPGGNPITTHTLTQLYWGTLARPHDVLGPHEDNGSVVVRALLPNAKSAWVEAGDVRIPMAPFCGYHGQIFEARTDKSLPFPYKLGYADFYGNETTTMDPYLIEPVISDFDRHLWQEGKLYRSYETFGAHPMEIDGIEGVRFTVWAPNATSISVIGDFNRWDKYSSSCSMSKIPDSGIWSTFIPGLREGDLYKYVVRRSSLDSYDYYVVEKADPFAFASEVRPASASVVANLEGFEWEDREWMENPFSIDAPMSIYEVHPGSWLRSRDPNSKTGFMNYRELAHRLVNYAKEIGYTHLELIGIPEHPDDKSWGYQITGYFAPTSRYGSPKDFMYFVNHCHKNGIGVLLDFVPGHYPKDGHGLERFDGTALFEHGDSRLGEHKEWGTFAPNFERPEVKDFFISSGLFWLDKYHIDGLRVDAVSSMLYRNYGPYRNRKWQDWIPNRYDGNHELEIIHLEGVDFLRELNCTVKALHPNAIVIAEESTSYPGKTAPTFTTNDDRVVKKSLGFDLAWNMGWMHDVLLQFFREDPLHRKYHLHKLLHTFNYAQSEAYVLPISHDEVVHGKGSLLNKMPGDEWQKFANLRLFLAFMFSFPGKKLLFMGNDMAQFKEWDYRTELGWAELGMPENGGINGLVKDLNKLYRNIRALHEEDYNPQATELTFYNKDETVISFVRRAANQSVVIVCNFTPVPRENYRIPVSKEGVYQEIFNTDSDFYGGSNVRNKDELPSFPGRIHPEYERRSWNYNIWGLDSGYLIKVPKLPALSLTMYEIK